MRPLRVVAAVAGVSVWLGVVTHVTTALATETTPVPPSAARTLAATRVGCGVDTFDEIATTTGARWTDLSWTAIRCVLDGIGAPTRLLASMTDLSPGHGRHSWHTGTVDWRRDDARRLVITVNLIDPRTQETR